MTTTTNATNNATTANNNNQVIHYYVDGLVYPHFTFYRRSDGKVDFAGNPGVIGDDGEYGTPITAMSDPADAVMDQWVGRDKWRRQRVPEDF